MTEQLFTKMHLLKALKVAGQPSSYSSLLHYEKKDVISKPEQFLPMGNRSYRAYTREEIKSIVAKIKEYRESRG